VFGVGLPELAVIAFVAVCVFGPDRLPELAQQAGRFLRRLRTYANAARDDLRSELGPEYADLELRDLDPPRPAHDRAQAHHRGDERRRRTGAAAGRPSTPRRRRATAVRR
jgi:sec-independent protein translocase protein TatB